MIARRVNSRAGNAADATGDGPAEGRLDQQFRAELDKAGLKAISMHVGYDAVRDRLDAIIDDAKVLGVAYVGVPWIKSPFTRKDCLEAINVFNQAGSKLAANGLKFFYHLHGYEFVPDAGGKGTLFDLLMTKTDPRFVSIQLDTAHVAFPGQDPAQLMRQYPGRFSSLHVKDVRVHGLMFEERNGYRRRLVIGPWSLKAL